MSACAGFDARLFSSLLTTAAMGRQLVYVQECTSTMELAAQDGVGGHGAVVLAESQLAGRGRQRGRTWLSRPRGNLYLSVVLAPKDLATLGRIGLAASVAAVEACRAHGAGGTVAKWPNDIWLANKKLGGMLVDSSIFSPTNVQARFGFGLNVNELFDGSEPVAATSLRAELGREVSRESLLAGFLNLFEPYLDWSTPLLVERYASYDFLCALDSVVVMPRGVEQPERVVAKPLGFADNGCLIVRYPDGSTRQLSAEEVSVRPPTSL